MQFLAFLQDSYREAKSGWMLQLMLVLAALMVLLIASVGFRPVSVNDELDYNLGLFSRFVGNNPEAGRPTLAVENVVSSNPAEPWKADYAFDYVVTCPSPEDMRKAHRQRLPVDRESAEQFLRSSLSYLNDVRVTGGPPELQKPFEPSADTPDEVKKGEPKKEPPLPREVRYQVTTKGTKAEDRLAWRHKVSVLFVYEVPFIFISLREGVYIFQKYLVNYAAGWILLFIGVVVTAGFIPNMLAKGSLDLMVSKPIGRPRLLLYKYIGGLTFVFLLTTFAVLGVWGAIGLRTGQWSLNFLAVIPVTTLSFAVLYAFSALAAVLSRHTLVAILLTVIAWGGLWVIGKVNDGIENRRAAEAKAAAVARAGSPEAFMREVQSEQPLWGFIPKSAFPAITALHTITPRTYEMDDRLGRVIAEGILTPNQLKEKEYDVPPRSSWAEMIGISLAGIAVLIGLGCWRFSSRDY